MWRGKRAPCYIGTFWWSIILDESQEATGFELGTTFTHGGGGGSVLDANYPPN